MPGAAPGGTPEVPVGGTPVALFDQLAHLARRVAGFPTLPARGGDPLTHDRYTPVTTDPHAEPPVTATLDVRFLEPPEPFERIAAALEKLGAGEALRVLIHREPRPLFRWLADDGFRHRSGWIDEGAAYEIVIWR